MDSLFDRAGGICRLGISQNFLKFMDLFRTGFSRRSGADFRENSLLLFPLLTGGMIDASFAFFAERA